MEVALWIAGGWALAALVVAAALWKDRERARETPLGEPLPHAATPPKPVPRRRRRVPAPAEIPTYPAARR